jgi:hypothetical protein
MQDFQRKEGENKNSGSLFSSFTLEANRARCGMGVFIGGIVGISDFSSESIFLKSHGCKVTVEGKRLSIKIYENNCVEIFGKVENIKFTYGKN